MTFNELYKKIIFENHIKQHINQNIAIMAGSFRIPFKYDINVINQLINKVNKIVIIVSGISKQRINNRQLSTTNILRLSNLFSKYKKNNQMQYIIQNIQNLSYIQLKQLLLNMKCSSQLKNKFKQYIQAIQKKIYSSIVQYNNIQITAENVIDLFNILIQNYKIQYIIAKQNSPIIDTIRYVNQNCQNCNIQLVSIDNIDQATTWQSLLKLFNNSNNIEQYFPITKYTINRQNVIKNLDNGLKYFNSEQEYNRIKEYFYGKFK